MSHPRLSRHALGRLAPALVSVLLCGGCSPGAERTPAGVGVTRLALPEGTVETEPRARKVVRRGSVYVPCYSQVYLSDGKPYNLAVTLSIRNTSTTQKLVVTSIDYHGSGGQKLKSVGTKEIELAPLAVAEVLVHEEDKSGGSGASFLVRWVAEGKLSEPIVEAVMVGSSGALGVSFLCSGRATEEEAPGVVR